MQTALPPLPASTLRAQELGSTTAWSAILFLFSSFLSPFENSSFFCFFFGSTPLLKTLYEEQRNDVSISTSSASLRLLLLLLSVSRDFSFTHMSVVGELRPLWLARRWSSRQPVHAWHLSSFSPSLFLSLFIFRLFCFLLKFEASKNDFFSFYFIHFTQEVVFCLSFWYESSASLRCSI